MYANEPLSFLLLRLSQQLETERGCPRANASRRRSTIVQMCQRFSACHALMSDIGSPEHAHSTCVSMLAPIWIALLRLVTQSHAGWPLDRTARTLSAWKLEEAARPAGGDVRAAVARLVRTLQVYPFDAASTFKAFFALTQALGLGLDQLSGYAVDRLGIHGRFRARTVDAATLSAA